MRYTEVIPDSLVDMVPGDVNPISVKGIVVNSTLILDELRNLLQDNDYDYRRNVDSYAAMPGVAPFALRRSIIKSIELAVNSLLE